MITAMHGKGLCLLPLFVANLLYSSIVHSQTTHEDVVKLLDALLEEHQQSDQAHNAKSLNYRIQALKQKRGAGSLKEEDIQQASILLSDMFDFSKKLLEFDYKVKSTLEEIAQNKHEFIGDLNTWRPLINSRIISLTTGLKYQQHALVLGDFQKIYDIANHQSIPNAAPTFSLEDLLADKGVGRSVCVLEGIELESQTIKIENLSLPGAPVSMKGKTYLSYSSALDVKRQMPLAQHWIVWKGAIQLDKNGIYRYIKKHLPPSTDCEKFRAKKEVQISPLNRGIKVEFPVVFEKWFCAETDTPCWRKGKFTTCTKKFKTKGPIITQNKRALISTGSFSDRVEFYVRANGSVETFNLPIRGYTSQVNQHLGEELGMSFSFMEAKIQEIQGKSFLLLYFSTDPMRLGKACQIHSGISL